MNTAQSRSNSNGCSNSFSNSPDPQIIAVLHGWFCNCQWCLQGIR